MRVVKSMLVLQTMSELLIGASRMVGRTACLPAGRDFRLVSLHSTSLYWAAPKATLTRFGRRSFISLCSILAPARSNPETIKIKKVCTPLGDEQTFLWWAVQDSNL